MQRVLCFGELLLRLSPTLQGKWLQNASIPVYTGGAELNVANALAKWNMPVSYFTALPANYLSKEIIELLKEKNINTSLINFSGERIGIYFLPQGADLKNAGVIYDRADSSFSRLRTGMFDWEKILEHVDWFHFSAITPALNEHMPAICREVLGIAARKNITISVDLNYRSKLWQYGKNPVEIMPDLVTYCDVIMGNIWSADTLLGIRTDEDIHNKKSKAAYLEQSRQTSNAIKAMSPKCKTIANTFRFDTETGIHYYATLQQNDHQYISNEFISNNVIDKSGSGDCFMAGLIYGLSNNHPAQEIINFAASAAYGKLHEVGDATSQTVEVIKSRLAAQA
ncbi:MAG: sugar kinase [Panacibacter sp.]